MGSSSLLWALGAVGVIFGLLHFVVGLLGAGLDLWWIGLNLALGIGLLVAAAFTSFDALRERMATGEARRAGRYGTGAVLGTAAVLTILASLGFLSTRYHWRFDWSEEKVHSLTDQSRKVLAALESDVQVLALYPPLDAAPVRELLDRYAYASERFQVEFADPNARPELLARYEISGEELGEGLLRVALGEESVELHEVGEEELTNAIVKLSRTGEKKVYFLEGHNERAIEGEAADSGEGYGRAAQALRNENYRVEKLLLAAAGEVPADADVVVAAGATRPLLDTEREALAGYLERGGALLVLVDPRANTDLVDALGRWGVDLGDDIIVDRELALFGRATSPFANRYDEGHPITREMRETSLFHVARSVRAGADAEFTELVFTGEASWAERDLARFFSEGAAELGDGDLPGPVPVGVAGTPRLDGAGGASGHAEADADEAPEPAAKPRLVVYGDADFASNELLEAVSNRDLFVNSVNWLIGDVEAISIRPKLSRASRFQLSSEQFLRIRSLALFVLPELVAVAGVVVWWWRRRAPAR